MSEPDRIRERLRADLPPDLDAQEVDALLETGEQLAQMRPLPRAAFRGDLARRLQALEPRGRQRSRAAGIRVAAAFASAGGLLLLIGIVSVAGAGPLAA